MTLSDRGNEKNLANGGDLKESFDFSGPDVFDESKYPPEVPGLKDAMDTFRTSLIPLMHKLLRAFALKMGLEDLDYFIKRHKALEDPSIPSQNLIRVNLYMPMDESDRIITDDSMRMQEHKDWGTLTLLIQDKVGGLEAKTRNGQWVPVTPIDGSIILNAGLMLEMWSGGLFPATVIQFFTKMTNQ